LLIRTVLACDICVEISHECVRTTLWDDLWGGVGGWHVRSEADFFVLAAPRGLSLMRAYVKAAEAEREPWMTSIPPFWFVCSGYLSSSMLTTRSQNCKAVNERWDAN
jgi:hypothetical protein